MRGYQEKKKTKKIIYSRLGSVLLAGFLIFLIYSTVKIYVKREKVLVDRQNVDKKLTSLEEEKSRMESEIAKLESEAGKEEELRKKFNVAKPGEKLIVVVDKKEKNDKIDTEISRGFLKKVWQTAKNLFR